MVTLVLNGKSYPDTDFRNGLYSEIVTAGTGDVTDRICAAMLDCLADASKNKTTTSASSVAVGTGAKTIVCAADVGYVVGSDVLVADAAAPTTNAMFGKVTSYTAATKTLVLDVYYAYGSGTISNWLVTVVGARGAAGTPGTAATVPNEARSSNTALAAADSGKFIRFTAGFTQTFVASATLGSSWWVGFVNDSSAVVTLDPNGSETLGGFTTLEVAPGDGGILSCDGSNLHLPVFSGINAKTAQDIARAVEFYL